MSSRYTDILCIPVRDWPHNLGSLGLGLGFRVEGLGGVVPATKSQYIVTIYEGRFQWALKTGQTKDVGFLQRDY